jgi:dihydrofolate synthase/folylpolyglutamate synthase
MEQTALLERLFRLHRFGIRPGLERITALLEALGNPHRRYPALHVTGTNGKGSVCALLASMLQAQGYRVGLYTSPHLCDFTERIRINGIPASYDDVFALLPWLLQKADRYGATFFEVTTALAFAIFAHHDIDIAVVEVGMGGRYDATNVIHPLVAVVTGIDYDHQQYLGHTLEEIAWQKIGIVKTGSAVVLGETRPWFLQLLVQWAQEAGARHILTPQTLPELLQATPDLCQLVRLPSGTDVVLPLAGEHQRRNLAVALAVRDLLSETFPITEAALEIGLRNVRQWGGLRARLELLRQQPPLIVDGAHNPGGIAALLRTLQEHGYAHTRWQLVFGVMADKDYDTMLRLLQPWVEYFLACAPQTERALPAEQLAEVARHCGIASLEVASSVADALAVALQRHIPTLITGSFYLAGEALKALGTTCALA